MRIAIIGGDAAGMSAASEAKRRAPDAEVVVLEMTQDVSYGACGMPYKLGPPGDMEQLKVVSAQRFREERGIDLRLGHRVDQIDAAEHRVRGVGPAGDFDLAYDRLIIATGARVSRPPIPGLNELWGAAAYPLKTLEDGRWLRRALDGGGASALIIGAGYIGLEVAEGLAARGLQVTILEALPEILPFLPDALRARVYAEATARGVTLRKGVRVERVERVAGGGVRAIVDGEPLAADLLVAATGVRPSAELAGAAGLTLGAAGAIAVDERLFTSHPDVLAAGDCADAVHAVTGKPVWIPLALRANRAGKIAGGNALGAGRKAPPVMGTAVFKFFELQIARTGLSFDEAAAAGFDPVPAAIEANTRAHYIPGGGKLSVWLLGDRRTGKLLGGALVGPEGAAHRIDTVVAALHAGLSAEQLYDMDLAYAPPFGPSWSPLLTCASQLAKQLRGRAQPGS